MLTDAQHLAELNAGDAFTGALKDVYGVEPLPDGYAGVFQESACGAEKLASTAIALVPVAVFDRLGAVAVAARTDYAVRPAYILEIGDGGGFVGELFEEFRGSEVAFVVAVDGGWAVGHATSIYLNLLW